MSCLPDPLDGGLAVADRVDDEALGLQAGGQEAGDSGLVLDDEDAHGGCLRGGDAGGRGPLLSFYHGLRARGRLDDRPVIRRCAGGSCSYGSAMQPTDCRTNDAALRAVIARLLARRRDASPSELVELLGEQVLWGPTGPPAGAA